MLNGWIKKDEEQPSYGLKLCCPNPPNRNQVSSHIWSSLGRVIPLKIARKGGKSPCRELKVKGLVQGIKGDNKAELGEAWKQAGSWLDIEELGAGEWLLAVGWSELPNKGRRTGWDKPQYFITFLECYYITCYSIIYPRNILNVAVYINKEITEYGSPSSSS